MMMNEDILTIIILITSLVSVISVLTMSGFVLCKTYSRYKLVDKAKKKTLEASNEPKEPFQENLEYSNPKSTLTADNYFQRRKHSQNIYFTFIPKVRSRVT